jgi:hypothetical protein
MKAAEAALLALFMWAAAAGCLAGQAARESANEPTAGVAGAPAGDIVDAAAVASESPLTGQGAQVQPAEEDLEEIFVHGREPRYVERTRRDRIGRIWAPVYIDGKGPFRLVLDTGASRSGVVPHVVTDLGMVADRSANVLLRGVTGTAQVPTIKVQSIQVGDLIVNSARMPVMTDALGGADGILGTEGLLGRRVFIDFHNDLIHISRSHGEPAPPGFITIPFDLSHGRLLITDAQIGSIRAKAIIDTGGQVSVGNLALRDALQRGHGEIMVAQRIEGVTQDVESAESRSIPMIMLGSLRMRMAAMSFADLSIFKHWAMVKEPAVMVGMDVLGLLDTLIIDYQRRELQLRLPDDAGFVR